MSLLDRLEAQLRERGLRVGPGAGPGELVLYGPASERTPDMMRALKAFRPQLLAKYGKTEQVVPDAPAVDHSEKTEAEPDPEPERCGLCNRDVSDPEDRERLRGVNPFCDRGEAKAVRDGNGVLHPGTQRCPYKT